MEEISFASKIIDKDTLEENDVHFTKLNPLQIRVEI